MDDPAEQILKLFAPGQMDTYAHLKVAFDDYSEDKYVISIKDCNCRVNPMDNAYEN